MKKIVPVLLLCLLGVSNAQAEELPLIRTLVLDPGHGGDNLGALGTGGKFEKAVTLELARQVNRLIERKTTIRVVLTRTSDLAMSLEDRIGLANSIGADLFISIHANSVPNPAVRGVETYVLSQAAFEDERDKLGRLPLSLTGGLSECPDQAVGAIVKDLLHTFARDEAMSFARTVQKKVANRVHSPNRGVKQLPMIVLRGAQMPAVLVELGFMSNPIEYKMLTTASGQRQYSRALYRAVIKEQNRRTATQKAKKLAAKK